MRRSRLPGLALLLTDVLASTPAAAVDVTGGAGLLYFDYQEFGTNGASLSHETGIIPGMSLGARQRAFGLEHAIAFTAWHGEVDYHGRTQAGVPHDTNTDQTIYDIRYRMDWRFRDSGNGLYGGLGWQNWDRDIQPAHGVSGLSERYRWWSLEAGLHADVYKAGRHTLFMEFGLLATTGGTIKIDLRENGYGYPSLDLGDGTGFTARAGWTRQLSDNASLSMLFDYSRWEFGRSNSRSISDGINVITITEPESRSKHASLRISCRYRL